LINHYPQQLNFIRIAGLLMNSRQRFLETMAFGSPDHAPLFKEGMRKNVFKTWKKQGLDNERDLSRRFHYDQREEIEPDLYPIPPIRIWPQSVNDLKQFKHHLNPKHRRRLPINWRWKVRNWKKRDSALILRVHIGFFLSMGVEEWGRFEETMRLTIDDPQLVRGMMQVQGEFAALMTELILRDVEVDAVLLGEPISSSHGPLISPSMYEELVLPSYAPVLDVVEKSGVENIIMRTYANSRALLRSILNTRINCLWACECNDPSLDYRLLRKEFGGRLRLIGGIDTNVLRMDQGRIREEVNTKVPPLLEQGGFVPLLDGRIRKVVPFENYVYYRQLLEDIVIGDKSG
jgi:uroporphyrinogen decarboxylase